MQQSDLHIHSDAFQIPVVAMRSQLELETIFPSLPGVRGSRGCSSSSILLILPSIVMIFLMRKYLGPEAIAGGFKMK